MELVKYELYKIFSQKVIYIAFIVFVSLFSFHFANEVRMDEDRGQLRNAFAQYGGQVTAEKIAWANQVIEQFKSENEKVKEAGGSETSAYKELILQADVAYQFANVEQLIQNYEQELIVPDTIGYHHGWKRILQFMSEIGCFFVGALTILGLSSSYSSEYVSRMDNLLFSSRNGRFKLAASKIGAATLYCAVVVGLFSAVAFILYGIAYSWDGGTMKLVNILSIFGQTGFSGTVWQYYLLQLAYTTIGCIAIGLLAMLLSSLTRFAILPAFLSGLVFIVPFIASIVPISRTAAVEWMFRIFRYFEFIQLGSLDSAFYFFHFFGIPVGYAIGILIIMIFYITLTVGLLIWSVSRRQVTSG